VRSDLFLASPFPALQAPSGCGGLSTGIEAVVSGATGGGEQRQRVLDAAFLAHPERFVKKLPTPPEIPAAAWINPPKKVALIGGDLH
jgi:putative transposase